MTTRAVAKQAGNAHGIILLLSAVMPIMAITSLIPVLPQLLREFAHVPGSSALVPIALTVPALCVAVFSPFAGWLSDRVGRKRLLVSALATYSVFGFLPWFLDDLTTIIGSRILLGLVEAIIMTVATALIGDYFEGEQRERWIAIQVAVSSVAATLLLAAGGALGEAFGSRGPFLLYLSSFAVGLAAALVLHEPTRAQRSGGTSAQGRGALLTVLPLAFITLGVGFAFYTIFVQIGPILELSGRVSPATVGLAGAIVNLGVVAGAVMFKRLAHRAGPGLLAMGLFLAALGYAGVAMSSGAIAITAFATLACLGSGVMLPNMLTWTMRSLPPQVRGRGLGIWTGSFFLGQFVAPLAVGAMAGPLGGLSNVIGTLAGLIGASALAAALIARMRQTADIRGEEGR